MRNPFSMFVADPGQTRTWPDPLAPVHRRGACFSPVHRGGACSHQCIEEQREGRAILDVAELEDPHEHGGAAQPEEVAHVALLVCTCVIRHIDAGTG